MDLWRSWFNETERQLNGFFGEILGDESFVRASSGYVDAYSVIQRSLNQSMERYLTTFNLPTHSDITDLGERLSSIEERLTSLESTIRAVAEKVDVAPTGAVTRLRPRRTRKPAAKSNDAS
ncbi:MAG: hypothetical protein DRI30_06620 [Chloroflexi bacterium]|nr:MAG: hypothetical protein DRI30_06620 [Chloroflexota bacterium]